MKVLVTGATGFVGRHLCRELTTNGHTVVAISRSLKSARKSLPYPVEIVEHDLEHQELPRETLNDVDCVVHLAGAPIADKRWSEKRKRELYDSRIKSTTHLVNAMNEVDTIRSFVCASAIGYYPSSEKEYFEEDHGPGDHFISTLCRDWELSAKKSKVQPSIVRIGLVLGRNEGMLAKLEPLSRANLASPLGSGRQWMSWIHVFDLVQIIMRFVLNPEPGEYNGVAPNPLTNREFTKKLNQKLKKWTPPSAPALVLKLAAGEMSYLLLASHRVKSKLPESLFVFQRFEQALEDIFGPDGGCMEFFQEQWFPQPVSEIFEFFSAEKNLEKITPPWLKFNVVSMSTDKIKKDTQLKYRLKLHGLPLTWTTRITEWNPPDHFQDEQIKGPYRVWKHDHYFKACAGGTLMQDRVRYKLPLGSIGAMFGGCWVKNDIRSIFKYREKTIGNVFSSTRNSQPA